MKELILLLSIFTSLTLSQIRFDLKYKYVDKQKVSFCLRGQNETNSIVILSIQNWRITDLDTKQEGSVIIFPENSLYNRIMFHASDSIDYENTFFYKEVETDYRVLNPAFKVLKPKENFSIVFTVKDSAFVELIKRQNIHLTYLFSCAFSRELSKDLLNIVFKLSLKSEKVIIPQVEYNDLYFSNLPFYIKLKNYLPVKISYDTLDSLVAIFKRKTITLDLKVH